MSKNDKSYLSDKDYNFIYSKSTRVCVDILIEAKGFVVLIKRDIEPYKGKWHLPGGRIMFRETVYDAIQRISKKELGIKIIGIPKLIGWMEFLRETQLKQKRHTVSVVFKCEVKIGQSFNGRWFNKFGRDVHPIHKKFLENKKYL